jgi:hypothetical protein
MGSDNHGVFYLVAGEPSWKRIGGGLPSQKVTALTVDGGTIYAAVYQEGVYASTDRGGCWTSLNLDLPNKRVKALAVCDGKLFAGTDVGIYELQAEVSTWANRFSGAQVVSLNRTGGYLVAGTSAGTLRSLDGGGTWAWTHREGAAHNTAILGSLSVVMNISSGLFLSGDRGATWAEAPYEPRGGSYIYDVERIDNVLVMSNNYGVFQSKDEGKSWVLVHETSGGFFFDLLADHGVLFGAKRF